MLQTRQTNARLAVPYIVTDQIIVAKFCCLGKSFRFPVHPVHPVLPFHSIPLISTQPQIVTHD